jgi:hypothetical protein
LKPLYGTFNRYGRFQTHRFGNPFMGYLGESRIQPVRDDKTEKSVS